MMSTSKLWSKDFIITFCLNFILTFVIYLFLVITSVYAVESFNATVSQAGLATGIFVIGALVGRLYIGNKVNEIGLRKTVYIGLLLFLLTTSFYLIEYSVNLLLVFRFLNGVAYGIVSTAVLTIAVLIIPEKRKGEGIGFFSLSNILSVALGPFIGIYLSQQTSYFMIFLLCTVLAISCILIAFFIRIPILGEKERKNTTGGFKLSNYLEIKAVPIALIVMVLGVTYSSILTFINFYSIEKNLVYAASFFFILYSAAVLISRPFSGKLMDQKGANYVMYPCFFIFAVGLLLLSIAPNAFLLLLAGALIGLGYGNLQSITQTITVSMVPPERIAIATTTFFVFFDIGLGLGPYLLSFIVQYISYSSLYGWLGMLILLTPIPYYLLYGKQEKMIRTEISEGKMSQSGAGG